DLVPLEDKCAVGQQALALNVGQRQTQRGRAFAQQLLLAHSAAGISASSVSRANAWCPPFRRWIISSEMAAGVTPEMREAMPSVSGRCLASFCRTSKLSALTWP